jgi:hypothetical protein
MSLPHSLSAGLAALALLVAPSPDRGDCGGVDEQYKTAVADVAKALRSYAVCIATSDRHNECAAEMQALDNAHDNFVDALSDAKDCK